MGTNDPGTPSKATKASEPEQSPATTSGTTAPVYPEWPGFQAYSAMPPHGFFPPPVAASPQAHPYMWGAQDSHSKENDVKEDGSSQNGMSHSASQGVLNQNMSMAPTQTGVVIGGVAPATNLNIGMDYWGATGSSPVPAMHGKAPSGSVRGEQWDEREIKKQKRKQSNRESARRSRLRKQEKLGGNSDSIPDMNKQNDTNGNCQKQQDSDAQPDDAP
uniref:BZIP domain-containing protein n=1 Tax=Leersia perrieri TaxID=77586 RepID=A0A0D9VBQ3_9ORYZ